MKLISLLIGLAFVVGCVTTKVVTPIPTPPPRPPKAMPLPPGPGFAMVANKMTKIMTASAETASPPLPSVHTVEIFGASTVRPAVMRMWYTNVTSTHLTVDASENLKTWVQGPSFDATTNVIVVIDLGTSVTPARFFRLRKTL